MKLPHRALPLSAVLLLAGCAKELPPAEPAADSTPPEPTVMQLTRGQADASALPVDQIKFVEVIVIGEISPELEQLLTEQHRLFAAMYAPGETGEAGAISAGALGLLSESELQSLNQQIEKLKAAFPPRLTSTFTVNGTKREYTSRDSLHYRYLKQCEAINLQKLVPVLNQISELLRGDYATLEREAERYADSIRGYQAVADINWIAGFSDYLKEYAQLVQRMDTLSRRASLRAAKEADAAGTPQDDFDQFQDEYAMKLKIDLYKSAYGTGFLNEDGTFQVEGEGKLIFRINDDLRRAIFFAPGMTMPTVMVTDVSTWEETVTTAP